MPAPDIPYNHGNPLREEALEHILDSLRGLRFGSVNIIVQDGVIVQIDRTEKRRVERKGKRI